MAYLKNKETGRMVEAEVFGANFSSEKWEEPLAEDIRIEKLEQEVASITFGQIVYNGESFKCDDITLATVCALAQTATGDTKHPCEGVRGIHALDAPQLQALRTAIFEYRCKWGACIRTLRAEIDQGILTEVENVSPRYRELMETEVFNQSSFGGGKKRHRAIK